MLYILGIKQSNDSSYFYCTNCIYCIMVSPYNQISLSKSLKKKKYKDLSYLHPTVYIIIIDNTKNVLKICDNNVTSTICGYPSLQHKLYLQQSSWSRWNSS